MAYKLGADLDFTGESVSPIGQRDTEDLDNAEAFSGRFDGNNFKILGFKFQQANPTSATALFAYAKGALIENLTIEQAKIQGKKHTALLVGYGENISVSNVNLSGSNEPLDGDDEKNTSGGLVGELRFDEEGESYYIKNINISSNIYAHDDSGSLLGPTRVSANNIQLVIENVQSDGLVVYSSGGNSMGGLISRFFVSASDTQVTFKNIHRQGDLILDQGAGSWSGGLFGQFHINASSSGSSVLFEDVSLKGTVASTASFNVNGHVGGIVGSFTFRAADASLTFNRVSVEGDLVVLENGVSTNSNFGGLIGSLGTRDYPSSNLQINHSYFDGRILSENSNNFRRIGGLVGTLRGSSGGGIPTTITASYSHIRDIITDATLSEARGLIGRYENSASHPTFVDVYYNAPASVSSADPAGSAGITFLNDGNILSSSSYSGSGWDFSSIWKANNGVTAPRLRE